jgi:hypothetical protein
MSRFCRLLYWSRFAEVTSEAVSVDSLIFSSAGHVGPPPSRQNLEVVPYLPAAVRRSNAFCLALCKRYLARMRSASIALKVSVP